MSLLYERALLLAKIESTFRTDPSPTSASDALLVTDPQFTVDITNLERNIARGDLSPVAKVVGRKLARVTFQHEVRNNGNTTGTSAPKLAVLLRACGMAETQRTGTGTITTPRMTSATVTATGITFTKGGAGSGMVPLDYQLTCVLNGASATAKFRVTGGRSGIEGPGTAEIFDGSVRAGSAGTTPTVTVAVVSTDPLAPTYTVGGVFQVGDIIDVTVLGIKVEYTVKTADVNLAGVATALAAAIAAINAGFTGTSAVGAVVTITFTGTWAGTAITTAVTALTLRGASSGTGSGGTITINFSGSWAIGDQYLVTVYPLSYEYTPVSENFDSATIYVYYDGLLHKLTGCRGTWSVEGTGGQYANFTFTFTGDYVPTIDVPIPSNPTYETQTPQQVESADLYVGGVTPYPGIANTRAETGLCASSFNIDIGNNVVPKECINAPNSYEGGLIVGRAPAGGFNPEATLESTHPFWDYLTDATQLRFGVRVGTSKGNCVAFYCPNIQYTGLAYQNRNGTRVYDLGFNPARVVGNDEISVIFA